MATKTSSSESSFGQVTTCPDPSAFPTPWQCCSVPCGPAVSHPRGCPFPAPHLGSGTCLAGSQPAAVALGRWGWMGRGMRKCGMVSEHVLARHSMSRHGSGLAGLGHAGEGGVLPLSRGAGLAGIGAAGGRLRVAPVSWSRPAPTQSPMEPGLRAGQPPGAPRGSAGPIPAR